MTTAGTSAQLREGFEKPLAEWGLGCVDAGVALGDPMFGTQGVHLDYQSGSTEARWCKTQLTAAPLCAKFLYAVWIKHVVAPAWAAASSPTIVTVRDDLSSDLASVRMAASSGGMVLSSLGQTDALTAPTVDVWEFWEIRGRITTTWLIEARRDGADVASLQSLTPSAPVRLSSIGLGDALVGVGADVIELDADRMWFWAGTTEDPDPDWWSATPGLDGQPVPVRIISATLGPAEFTVTLGASNTGGEIMHALAGEDNTIPVTVQANVTLDLQTVEIGLAPRGSSPLAFYTAAWVGTADTTRVAELDIGPGGAVDPAADIYEVWTTVGGSAPYLASDELILT